MQLAFLHFSPTHVYFLQSPPPPPSIFLQLFLSYAVRSAFFTPHTRTHFLPVQTNCVQLREGDVRAERGQHEGSMRAASAFSGVRAALRRRCSGVGM